MTMFPEINSLPGAQSQSATIDRDREIYRREGGADMSGHIIIAFGSVNEKRIAVRDETGEERLQIAPNIWVGVFLDEE